MSYLKGDLIVSKIDKERLFKGDKHTHFYFIAFPKKDAPDTFLIKRQLSKEEIESKVETEILGEIVLMGAKENVHKKESVHETGTNDISEQDELPF